MDYFFFDLFLNWRITGVFWFFFSNCSRYQNYKMSIFEIVYFKASVDWLLIFILAVQMTLRISQNIELLSFFIFHKFHWFQNVFYPTAFIFIQLNWIFLSKTFLLFQIVWYFLAERWFSKYCLDDGRLLVALFLTACWSMKITLFSRCYGNDLLTEIQTDLSEMRYIS